AEDRNALAVLTSRLIVEEFIQANNILPLLLEEREGVPGHESLEGDDNKHLHLQEAVDYFVRHIRSVSEDAATGLVTLSIEWSDAHLAQQWANELVRYTNDRIRRRDVEDAQRRLQYLNEELEKASLLELRQVLARLIEEQVQRLMLAQGEVEYGFKVI